DLGYRPDFVIGNPVNIAAETLRSGARVILPADPEGHATGLERIQELGVGAMTFPAATDSPTDLALLMANYHEAEIIVAAGTRVDLDGMFHDQKNATPAALLTRAKVGPKLVDADVIVTLYTVSSGRGTAWLWA
ncbi:thiamine pyrophosphokinase, partial [Acinetobacter baumannii]|nr:thiamine pyrophosphokinase [Acinetobacter baumannii]